MPENDRWSFLREALISLRLAGADGNVRREVSLPEVLSMLVRGEPVVDFPRLRPHQAHAWYAFLVQLGAMAQHRAGERRLHSPADWADALLDLADGKETAWCLVAGDLGQPALFQPGVPEGNLAGFKNRADHPDQIDMLVTAKNHDLKGARMAHPRPEHWAFALLTLQTMEGYSGKFNYGIVRMNSGLGNRPCVALAPGLGWSERFCRDRQVLIERRSATAGAHGFHAERGSALAWLEPWDGRATMGLQELDPYFVEICRRIRLVAEQGRALALVSNSQSQRTDGKDRNGDLGDPWTPIDRAEAKALTVSAGGFNYKLTQELLLGGKYQPPPALELQPEDRKELLFWASALTRGQGKTEGLHQRLLPIPAKVRATLGRRERRERAGRLAERRVDVVETVRRKLLHTALCALLQGAPPKLDFRDDRSRRWTEALDRAVDEIFFERLWRDLDEDEEAAELRWAQEVIDLAAVQLESAIDGAPVPASRFYRAVAAATRVFRGAARKNFPDLYERRAQGAMSDDRREHEPVA